MAQRKRPGQKTTQKANTKLDHLRKAKEVYEEIEAAEPGSAPDLKQLINTVQVMTKEKSQQDKRLTKKQMQVLKSQLDREMAQSRKADILADAEAQVAAEEAAEKDDELKTRELALKESKKDVLVKKKDKKKKDKKQKAATTFEVKLKALKDEVDKKRAAPSTINSQDVQKFKIALLDVYNAYQKLKAKVDDPTGSKLAAADKNGDVDQILKLLKKQIDDLDLIAQRNERVLDAEKKSITPIDQKTDYRDLYQSKLGRFLRLGADEHGKLSLSRSMMKAAEMLGRKIKGKVEPFMPGKVWESGVTWALRKAGNNPKAVQAILRVDRTMKSIAGGIKTLGHETYDWIHKSMGDIFGYLRRKWQALSSGDGAGALGKLVGLGALFTSLIGPLLSGINAELEKRYGKDYIQSFVKSLWEGAKGWLLNGLKSFFFGDEKSPQIQQQKEMQKAANAVVTGKAQKEAAKVGLLGKLWDVARYGDGSDQVITNTLDEYQDKDTTADKRGFDKIYLTDMLKKRRDKKQPLPITLATKLTAAGFDVSGIGTTVDPPPPPAAQPMFRNLRGGFLFGSQKQATAVAAPVQASTPPVSARPPAPPTTTSAASGAGTKGPGSAPGLGNAQLPNTAVSDTFHTLNIGGLSHGH